MTTTAQEFETYNYTPFGNSTFEAGGTVYPVATPEVGRDPCTIANPS